MLSVWNGEAAMNLGFLAKRLPCRECGKLTMTPFRVCRKCRRIAKERRVWNSRKKGLSRVKGV